MMLISAVRQVLLAAALLQAPSAELETVKGDRHSGRLTELSATSVVVENGSEKVSIPLDEILEIRLPQSAALDPLTGARVALFDGTRLTCTAVSISDGQARLESARCGTFTLGVARLAQVRLGISTAKLDEAWSTLLARESRSDLLVVKREEVLDFLTGVTGDLGEKVSFLVDGEELSVSRDKVYGVIFRRRPPSAPRTICQIRLHGGDLLQSADCRLDGESLSVKLAAGPQVKVPLAAVSSLDFSAGKVRYLSQLEPRDVKYVPYFDLVREYRRDKSLDGTPLSLSGKSYSRGLAIKPRTTLRYRIGGEYSRLAAVVGIDDSVRRLGNVRVVVSGDGKSLFDEIVKGTDAPRPLDLDISGVRDLEILVDFGSDNIDIGDHLDLAEARLLK